MIAFVQEKHLALLCCPVCRQDLSIAEATRRKNGRLERGTLACAGCERTFPVVRYVPRFVSAENYADNFGLEWSRHARTQYDSESGVRFSERRFFEETGWPRRMEGDLVLEAGSGSGRFTEQALRTGATVVSFDLSCAVDANYSANGGSSNVLLMQADIFQIPCRPATFDRIYCFGVLQHTPDPRMAFRSLPPLLKPGGMIVADVYKKTFVKHVLGTKYWVRPFTRNMPPDKLYKNIQRYVDFMWPVASVLRHVPKVGTPLNWRLLIGDYTNEGVPAAKLKEWAYLDTFDMLSPKYDYPQTLQAFRSWFEESQLVEIDVRYGYNGVQGRGRARGL